MIYRAKMTAAGLDPDSPQCRQVLRLLEMLDAEDNPPRHVAIDLFTRLARCENLPDARVRDTAALDGLTAWQRYVLDCFPREAFYAIPEPIRSLPTMWRYATWEHLVSDVLNTGAVMVTALLSLFFRPRVIVEMGVDCGWTLLLWSRLNPEATVIGVDNRRRSGNAPLPVGYVPMVHECANVRLETGTSWEYAHKGVDLCLIDGEHIGEAPYLDSQCAWRNRNTAGEWAIVWDDYHPTNPDVVAGVDRFTREVGYPLQKLYSWVWIGSKTMEEEAMKARFS